MNKIKELKLNNIVSIPTGIGVSDAIFAIVTNFTDISDVDIEEINQSVPYTIKKNEDESVYDLLTILKDLYMGYEMFINENGTFVFQAIR
jgi:hypothetical protein